MELYGRVRYAVRVEGADERAAARRFGLDPQTVSKMMKFGAAGLCPQEGAGKTKADPVYTPD